MNRRACWVAIALAFASALSSSGCATSGKVRRDYLAKELNAHRYAKPLDEVWQQVRLLLAQTNFRMGDADAEAVGQPKLSFAERIFSPARETYPFGSDIGILQRMSSAVGSLASTGGPKGLSLDTHWKSTGIRYHVDGLQDAQGCYVIFTKVIQDHTDHHDTYERDPEMELDLARRLDPSLADRLESDLEKMKH